MYLRKVIVAEGPLQPRGKLIEQVLQRYEANLGLRDVLPHGAMSMLTSHSDSLLTFTDYSAQGPAISMRQPKMTRSDLERRTLRIARTCRAASYLYSQVNGLLPLIGYENTQPLDPI
jgi:hypothetical protein